MVYDNKFIMDNALDSLITVGSIELFRCVHRILLNNIKMDSCALGCYALTAWPCRMLINRKGGSSQLVPEPGLSMNACVFHNLLTLLKYPVYTPSL